MVIRRLENPGTSGMIFRRVYDDLKKNHIDKFFEEFPHLYQYYHITDKEVVLPPVGGKPPSRIVFGYAETEAEVKRKFHGPEYMDIFVDQAEQVIEDELKIMKTCCRWPGTTSHACKFVLFFNPGGKGLQYLRRIFREKKFRDKERSADYAFIQAYGWDNVEWVRSALVEDGLTEDDFYAWSDEIRFSYFVTRSQYGQQLDGLPQAMRIGHLLGSMDTFAGQYFDIWDSDLHTKKVEIQPWHPKWLSIDWGFAHKAATLWHAQDDQVTKTYRELIRQGIGPRALAQEIVDHCKDRNGGIERLDAIYLSPDAFAKRTTEDPIASQMGSVFRQNGFPYPRPADDDRISGWALMYDMLRYGQWVVSESCPELINNIPLFSRDDKNQEDCVKFEGDDPGDSARYGLKSRFTSKEMPRELQLDGVLKGIRSKVMAATNNDMGAVHTAAHIAHLKFDQSWKHKHRPIRRIKRWRP